MGSYRWLWQFRLPHIILQQVLEIHLRTARKCVTLWPPRTHAIKELYTGNPSLEPHKLKNLNPSLSLWNQSNGLQTRPCIPWKAALYGRKCMDIGPSEPYEYEPFQNHVGWEDLSHKWCFKSYQRCLEGLRSGFCAGHSSSSTPNPENHVFMAMALCTGRQSCLNTKGPSLFCYHKH